MCSGNFEEETPMVMTRSGSNICVPCSETPRGKGQCQELRGTEGYRPDYSARSRFDRAVEHWFRGGRRGGKVYDK